MSGESMEQSRATVNALLAARAAIDEAIASSLAGLSEDERAELLADEVAGFGLPAVPSFGAFSPTIVSNPLAGPSFRRLGGPSPDLAEDTVNNNSCNSGCGGGGSPKRVF